MRVSQDQTQQSISLAEIIEPLSVPMKDLDAFFEAQIKSFEPEIQELVSYTFSYSGKRLRPILTFFAGAKGGKVSADVIRGAAVVEMTHLATLVHDDILDDADIRRNVPTVFKKHGAHVSVLLGDAIFAQALYIASQFSTTEVCSVVSLATQRVCAGEISQTFQRGNIELSLENYYRIINLKTAELFDAAAYIGAYLSGNTPDACQAIRMYARHMGVAYQMFDDVADMLGAEEKIGKTLGTDLESGKYTLPILLLLDALDAGASEALKKRILEHQDGVQSEVMALIQEYSILPKVKMAFLEELDQGEAVITPYSDLQAYTPLKQLGEFIRQQIDRYIP
jgi:octaprenyl-diphosphate synthase